MLKKLLLQTNSCGRSIDRQLKVSCFGLSSPFFPWDLGPFLCRSWPTHLQAKTHCENGSFQRRALAATLKEDFLLFVMFLLLNLTWLVWGCIKGTLKRPCGEEVVVQTRENRQHLVSTNLQAGPKFYFYNSRANFKGQRAKRTSQRRK